MAVDVPERALRGVPDLVMLVEAVLRADTKDENDWLEWKSSLDLSNHHGIFAIAKCILAMGNRHPDHAAAKMGGLGFMIVGAAAGQGGVPEGVAKLDEVVLAQKLGVYLGNEHPQYDARYLLIQDKQVLIITVEPPKWGDPVWVTWKGYQPENDRKQEIPEASVFVRMGSQSVRAKASQFKAVEHRSRTSAEARVTLDLDTEVLGDLLVLA